MYSNFHTADPQILDATDSIKVSSLGDMGSGICEALL